MVTLELDDFARRRSTIGIAEGYRMAPVTWAHAAAVQQLPFYHRDPFDRLLVAHARAERYTIVTRDRVFRKYGVDVVW